MNPHIKPLGPALAPLRWAITNPIKARLKEIGIHMPFEQLIILKMLRHSTCVASQQDMAEKLGKDKSVIMRMVDALEKEELLYRVADPNDRRRNQLKISEKGGELLNRFEIVEMEVTHELMKGLSNDDMDAFYKVLEHIKIQGEKISKL